MSDWNSPVRLKEFEVISECGRNMLAIRFFSLEIQ